MNSQYFSQYLLNNKILPADRVRQLLKASVGLKPELPVLAVRQGLITAEQVADIDVSSSSVFTNAVVERGLLTNNQVTELLQGLTGESMSFAQAMLNDGISLKEIEKFLKDYNEADDEPVRKVISSLAGEELASECAIYGEFADVFMRSVIRFMDTPAVINFEEPYIFDFSKPSHIVSQSLVGDINLVTGIFAQDDVFVELARRYSCEDLKEADQLALDSVMEFFNVLNGLYAVEISKRDLDVDLETPTIAENVEPMGNRQLVVRVETGFGSFALIMAADEFIFA